jgi:hypothetical protein
MIYDLNANPLNANEWAFPLTECFHITSFALSIGTIMMVDLRLLGLGMLHQTGKQLLKDTGLWTLAGLIVVITSGLIIFSSDPIMYLHNPSFKYKVTNLMLVIIFNYTVHRKVTLLASEPGAAGKTSGALPWLIGLSVIYAGYLASVILTASAAMKVGVVLLAILFSFLVQFAAPLSGSPAEQKTVGIMSIAMWVSIVFGGLWIAFV